MRTAKILLFVILLALPAAAPAQNKTVIASNAEYIVEHAYTTENGLPANGINKIHQDQKGYLWAATFNGLVRYDGIDFTIYNANNLPELDSNRFMEVTSDLDGNIWAGLEYSNVVQITEETSSVYQIDEELAGPNISINSIIHTGPNQYWMGTNAGLFFFDGTRFSYRDDLPREAVQMLVYQDEKLYVLFARHLYGMDSDGTEEKLHLQIQDGVLSNSSGYIVEEFRDFEMLSSVMIHKDYFLLTSESGIVRMFDNRHEFLLKKEDIGLTNIHGLESHNDAYYVFGSNGVFRFSNLHGDSLKAEKYSETRVINLFFDSEDTMWLSTTASGIHKIIETPVYQGDRYRALDSTAITAIFEDSNGHIWVGSNCDNLHQFNEDAHTVFGAAEGIENSCVWSVTETSNGTIWAGTWGDGAFYKLLDEERFHPYRPDAMGNVVAVLSIYEDSIGNIWFGTYYNGVFRFDGTETLAVSSPQANRFRQPG